MNTSVLRQTPFSHRMAPMHCRILLTLLVVSVSACAGQRQTIVREPSSRIPPTWLTTPPLSEEFVYAVGSATGAESLQAGRDIARSNAANQLASFVGVDIVSGIGITTKHDDRFGSNTTVSTQSQTRTAARLVEVDVVDEYHVKTTREAGRIQHERFDVCLLCLYRKSSAAKERERMDQENRQLASDALNLFVDATNSSETAQDLALLMKLTEARTMLDQLPDSTPLPSDTQFGAGIDAGSLKREVARELSIVETRHRTLDIHFEDTSLDPNQRQLFVRELGKTLTTKDIGIGENGRFLLVVGNLEFTVGGIVLSKQAVSLAYTYEIRDKWNNDRVSSSGSGITKGFGNDATEAADEAVRAVAKQIASETIKNQ